MSICKYEESTTEEQFRGKHFKSFDQNLAYVLAARILLRARKVACTGRGRSMEFSKHIFGAFVVRSGICIYITGQTVNITGQTVKSQLSQYLVGFFHVVYEWALSLSASKPRRYKIRKEETKAKSIFLLTLANLVTILLLIPNVLRLCYLDYYLIMK